MASIYRDEQARDRIRSAARDALDRWGVAHDTRMLTTELGPTHVVRAGEGPQVVVLPGTNFAAATMLDLITRLAAGHQVLAVDLPGQPGLSHHERPRTPDRYGRWLARLLADLTDRRPVLIGHSLGGRVALSGLIEGAPAAGAVLVDPAGLIRLRVPWRVMRPTIPWMISPDDRSSEGLLAAMMAPSHRPDPSAVAWMAEVGRSVRTSLAPPPLRSAALASVDASAITVVCGEHDAFLPVAPLRRATARHLPDAEFVVARDAGHLVPDERPEVVAELAAERTGGRAA